MNTLKEYKAGFSEEELNMIFNSVLKQTPYVKFQYTNPIEKMKVAMELVAKLVSHEKPIVYIHTIINEIRLHSGLFYKNPNIYSSEVIALKVYSLLYYRYKDDAVYKDSILPHLQKLLGYFDSTSYPLSKTLEIIDALPSYNDVHSDKTKFLTEEEVSIIDKLTAENNRLEKKVKELEQRIEDMTFRDDDDDESDRAVIERNVKGKTVIHKTTAKECVKTLIDENVKAKLKLTEWEAVLSKITGISETSFQRFLSQPEL